MMGRGVKSLFSIDFNKQFFAHSNGANISFLSSKLVDILQFEVGDLEIQVIQFCTEGSLIWKNCGL